MRKMLAVLVMGAFLVACGLPALAEEKPSLNLAVKDVAEAVEENPVNVVSYMDFMAEFVKKFLQTSKPMVGFVDETRPGLEITLYEGPGFGITFGKFVDTEDSKWFVGIEAEKFPVMANLAEIFERLCPQVILYDKGVWLGLSYKFRAEE